jgi:hypothetical protein
MFEDLEVIYILLPVMVSLLAVMLLLHLTRNKQATPLEAAFRKFKFATIFYGILFFVLMLCLPSTGLYKHLTPDKIKSLEDAAQYQRYFGADLNRIKEIIYWIAFITAFWFWAVFNLLKVMIAESVKKI